jgi:putative acetyltransferase
MENNTFEIMPYNDAYKNQLFTIWEESVIASHHFLKASDFKEIKKLVLMIDFNEFQVYCIIYKNLIAGFIGIHKSKVEMLFIHPSYFHKGLGSKLLNFAKDKHFINEVDVNEQNQLTVNFYEKHGFKTYERSEKDDQGKLYPILKMKLA